MSVEEPATMKSRIVALIENLDWWQAFSIFFILLGIFYLVQDDTHSFGRWMWALQLPLHTYNLAMRRARKRESELRDAVDELLAAHQQLRQKIRELLTPRE